MVFLRRLWSINWWSDEFQDVYTAKKSALKRLIPDTNQRKECDLQRKIGDCDWILFKFKNVLDTNVDIRYWGWMFQYPSNRWRQMPSCGNCLEFWSRQFDNSGLQDDALNHSHNMTDFFHGNIETKLSKLCSLFTYFSTKNTFSPQLFVVELECLSLHIFVAWDWETSLTGSFVPLLVPG